MLKYEQGCTATYSKWFPWHERHFSCQGGAVEEVKDRLEWRMDQLFEMFKKPTV